MSDGILVAIGTLVTALVAAVLSVSRTAVNQYRKIVTRMEKQIARLDVHIGEQQAAIEELHAEHGDCQVSLTELWGCLVLQHHHSARLDSIARAAGEDPGALPVLPSRPRVREARDKADFVKRTSAQNTALVQEIDSKILPPRTGSES